MKKSLKKKAINALATSALLTSAVVPAVGVVAPATVSAATTFENILSVQTFDKGNTTPYAGTFAKIKINLPKAALADGNTQPFFVRLPQDFKFDAAIESLVDAESGIKATVTKISDREVRVDVTGDAEAATKDGVAYIALSNLVIPSSASGEVKASIEAAPGTVFTSGEVTVAKVSGGTVDVSIDDVKVITDADGAIANIRIKEDMAAALKKDGSSVKLKLPKGFYWDKDATVNVNKKWGAGGTATVVYKDYSDDEQNKPRSVALNVTDESTAANYLEISGLKIKVDETEAQKGDVTVAVSGESTVSAESLVVAKYGSYAADVAAVGDAPVLLAGRENIELGSWSIKEQVPNSLIKDRTITLTLPEGAKWDYDVENNDEYPKIKTNDSELNGLEINKWTIADTERRVLKTTIKTATTSGSKPAKIVFEKGTIAIEPGFKGDLKVAVGGSAGANGEVVLGKVQSPVEATVTEAKNVKIGFQDQVLDDLVIAETKKGAILNKSAKGEDLPGGTEGTLVIEAPTGVTFSTTPTASVIEGDADIEKIWSSPDKTQVLIKVNSKSDKLSKIKVSGLKVTLDRNVPEGDLKLKLKGDALVHKNIWTDGDYVKNNQAVTKTPYFRGSDVSTTVVAAKVITPAPTDTKAQNVVFKLNSKTYTVDGKQMEMDAAPLVGWDRAYLPIRFAANALNVSDNNIIWDDKTSTFTIFKGDRVITGKVGDKFLTVNGVKVPMEVPVWRNKVQTNNRVMVPIRYLANALNASIEWNKETSEITIGVK